MTLLLFLIVLVKYLSVSLLILAWTNWLL